MIDNYKKWIRRAAQALDPLPAKLRGGTGAEQRRCSARRAYTI